MTPLFVRALLIPLGPPVHPDPPEARRLLQQELSKPEYQRRGSILDDILERIGEWYRSLSFDGFSGNSIIPLIVVLALIAVAIFAILRTAARLRGSGSSSRGSILDLDDSRTAAELRTESERLAALGSFTEALMERFRAVARSLEERALVSAVPGRTARELTQDAAARFPATQAEGLRGGAADFDGCAYGKQIATRSEYEAMVALDSSILAARPLSSRETATVAGAS